jgi:hypothetical protein
MIDKKTEYAEWTFSMDKQNGYEAWTCNMNVQNLNAA